MPIWLSSVKAKHMSYINSARLWTSVSLVFTKKLRHNLWWYQNSKFSISCRFTSKYLVCGHWFVLNVLTQSLLLFFFTPFMHQQCWHIRWSQGFVVENAGQESRDQNISATDKGKHNCSETWEVELQRFFCLFVCFWVVSLLSLCLALICFPVVNLKIGLVKVLFK